MPQVKEPDPADHVRTAGMVCGGPAAACAVGAAAPTATGTAAATKAAAGRIRRDRMDLPGSLDD
ncbi:hypothetical protein GCM10009839_31350 [Catenulispora yoronensis]|uniref:Uncharacterized protein n=1 Tax=Catenulispora yoronensis TaxID=450799 RepID=A0ABN2U6D6_9ACTN